MFLQKKQGAFFKIIQLLSLKMRHFFSFLSNSRKQLGSSNTSSLLEYNKESELAKKTIFQARERIEQILEQIIFTFPSTKNVFTFSDAVTGIQCFGEIGSGKSSGAMKFIAKNYLRIKFGFMVLCAKSDERKFFERLCKETAREQDLVIFDAASGLSFNILEYEMHRNGPYSGETNNLVDLLRRISEIGQNFKAGSGSGKEERFWINGTDRLLGKTIDLIRVARQPLTFANIRKVIIDMFTEEDVDSYDGLMVALEEELPTEQDVHQHYLQEGLGEPTATDIENVIREAEEEKNKHLQFHKDWKESNFFLYCLTEAKNRSEDNQEEELFEAVRDYFFKQNIKLSEKTRSIFVESILGLVEPFLREGILKNHFTNGVSPSLLPERTYAENTIIVVDFPIKEYGISGVYANVIMKFIWQLCMERRLPEEEENPRPAVLWVDESHLFINPSYDTAFQSTSRSVMAATVYITQNVNAYYTVMGENNAVALTKNFISNISSKVFCANACFDTNEYAAKTIGKSFIPMDSISINSNNSSSSLSTRYEYHYKLPPEIFTSLKKGRRANKYQVEAIIFQTGREWLAKQNYAKIPFDQRY